MAGAALLLVLGALGVGAGGLLEARGRRKLAIRAAAIGGGTMLAAIVLFVLRPAGEPAPLGTRIVPARTAAARLAPGALQCTFDPARSRVTVSSDEDVALDWNGEGCVGRTQYVEADGRWQRVLVPDRESTVSLLSLDPASGRYTATRYFLGSSAMGAIRAARGTTPGACTTRPDTLVRLGERQAALRALLPPTPNEKLAYRCRRVGARQERGGG